MEQMAIEKVALNSEVEIVANDVSYRGTVVKFDPGEGKVTLKDVKMIKDNKPVSSMGQLHFFRDDIQNMKFVDEESVLRKMDPTYLLMKPFHRPYHLRGQCVPSDEEIVKLGRSALEKDKDADDDTPSAFWSSSINSVVLDEINEFFSKTISLLKEQSILAIAAQGVMLSRQGELCWLAIGTSATVYLFDFVKLGERIFIEGLTEILQSTRIMKVMHDCRFLSDYLFHKHQIILQHVWDTQVGRVVVYKQQHFGDLPRYVESLPKVLHDILGVDPNKFPMLWSRSYAAEKDQSVWKQRPLPESLQKVLESQVTYLFDLRNALLQRIMQDLTTGVDVYLNNVRDARHSEVPSLLRSDFFLPMEFFQIADAAKERYQESIRTSEIDPLTGFRESVGRLSFWKMRFSRDAWHGVKQSDGSALEEEESEVD